MTGLSSLRESSGIKSLRTRLTTAIDPGFGADGAIRAVALADASQAASKLLVAGAFQAFNGVYHSRVARLDYDGSLDSAFSAGGGANADVFALAVQADGRVLIGGAFSEVDFRSRSGVARLMSSGALDRSTSSSTNSDASYCVAMPANIVRRRRGVKTSLGGPVTAAL